jgi:NADH-quinone oxidoreductase subunit I
MKRLFRRPVTELYPYEVKHVAPASRIFLTMATDEAGDSLCRACLTCVTACPDHVLRLTADPEDKRRVAEFLVNSARCTFCGACVEGCTYGALEWSQDFERAVYDRDELIYALVRDGRPTGEGRAS